jgi:hypothetical protein
MVLGPSKLESGKKMACGDDNGRHGPYQPWHAEETRGRILGLTINSDAIKCRV